MRKNRGLNLPLLRRITNSLVEKLFPNSSREIGVHFVTRKRITSINEKFLGHHGSTDVITFDYSHAKLVHADILICLDEAVTQAREFDSTPQLELVRYIVHGLLHLCGHDDRRPQQRERMKRTEDRWVRWVTTEFPCDKVWSRKRAG